MIAAATTITIITNHSENWLNAFVPCVVTFTAAEAEAFKRAFVDDAGKLDIAALPLLLFKNGAKNGKCWVRVLWQKPQNVHAARKGICKLSSHGRTPHLWRNKINAIKVKTWENKVMGKNTALKTYLQISMFAYIVAGKYWANTMNF